MKWPFHPFLLAVYPVLALYSINTRLVAPSQIFQPASAIITITVIVWVGFLLIFRDLRRSAAAASVGVLYSFTYGHVVEIVHTGTFDLDLAVFLYSTVSLAVFIYAIWKRSDYLRVTQFLNIVAICLIAFPATIYFKTILVRRAEETPANSNVVSDSKLSPSIYEIILDGHGRSDALKRIVGVDNSAFTTSLRKEGFYVGDRATTNYVQTELSLASFLNFDFIQDLFPNEAQDIQDRANLDDAITDSRLSKVLKRKGYTYIGLRTGFPFIDFHSADMVLGSGGGSSLLASALWGLTPFHESGPLRGSQFEQKRKDIIGACANLVELSKPTLKPKLVVAHILAPHPPFVFNADGSFAPPTGSYKIVDGSHFMENGGTIKEYHDGYAAQVTYLDKLILETVSKMLANDPHAVIVIQGDHGSKLELDQEELLHTNLHEVVPILLAIHAAPELVKTLPQDLSAVNEYRYILNYYFNAKLPILDTKTYYSPWSSPYKFTDVTDKVTSDRQ